ncbi:MAG: MBL fold metallo-hydrolase, partial [Chloroflexi bacterium]|nr:MBL fold metallo-hydrolase [Chloroflexota bacterium]
LIDAGMSPSAKHIFDYIKKLGYQPTDLKRILITHADTDHVRGLPTLIEKCGATVATSDIEAQALADGKPSRPLKLRGLLKLLFGLVGKLIKFPKLQVDEILQPGQVLAILGGLEVVPTPGHTPKHISIHLREAGVLFAGDSLRANKDELVISHGFNTWDEDQARESARLQAELRPHIVCVGHGSTVFDAEEKIPKNYLE